MTETQEPSFGAAENTDKHLWPIVSEDPFPDSIHVTKDGGIGINVGGHVIVMPLRAWHRLAAEPAKPQEGEAVPVAWRVKDFADGWIYVPSEEFARSLSNASGALIEPLYLHPRSRSDGVLPVERPPLTDAEVAEEKPEPAGWLVTWTEGGSPCCRVSLGETDALTFASRLGSNPVKVPKAIKVEPLYAVPPRPDEGAKS